MPGAHAILAPSAAARWLVCPGSINHCKDIPNTSSEYAIEGTAAHHLSEMCLKNNHDGSDYVGLQIEVEDQRISVTKEMAAYVQVYLDYVRRESEGKSLYIEQRLSLTPLTTEADARGTADAVIVDGETLHIIDLKFGQGVKIYAEENEQMMMYAAAAYLEYNLTDDYKKFRVIIVQPRLDHIDEWEFDIGAMQAFISHVREIAPRALDGTGELCVTEHGCRFCPGKSTCPELTKQVEAMTSSGFDDLDKTSEADLSASMRAVDMVEGWCRSVRAEVERRLLAGMKVVGYKLVQGRRGARQWIDNTEAVLAMQKLGLPEDVVFKKSVLTPTQIEKSIAKTNEEAWNTLAAMTVQKEGLPSVAASTDPRPEFNAGDGFGDLDAQ